MRIRIAAMRPISVAAGYRTCLVRIDTGQLVAAGHKRARGRAMTTAAVSAVLRDTRSPAAQRAFIQGFAMTCDDCGMRSAGCGEDEQGHVLCRACERVTPTATRNGK